MKKIYAIFAVFVFLAFAGTAFAAAPVINLNAADNITETSARLSLSVTSSSTVSYMFEYGTDPSFGISTMLPTSSTSVTVSSLTAGTTYYYRVQASNNDGSTVAPLNGNGDPSYYSFKTVNYKTPIVDTLGADNLTSTGATLNGRTNTYGNSGTYYFRYYAGATCASYLGNTTSQSLGSSSSLQYVSSTVSGLSAGQKYCAQLVVIVSGTEYPDSKISFVTKTTNNNNNNNTNHCDINSFYADANSVYSGSSTTLRWSTSGNCTSISIDKFGSVSSTGSRGTGALYSTTTYVLSVSGPGFIDPTTKDITIGVLPNNNNNNNNNPACYAAGTCYWNGSSWIYYSNNNNNNTNPTCYYTYTCYWNGSTWVYGNNNNYYPNTTTVNTFTGTYPACYYDATCYWSGSTWVYNAGGNVSGNYSPYTYNPHQSYTGGPNYVYKTVSGGVNTVYVDQEVTQYQNPNQIISYNGGYNYGYDTSIMSRYSPDYRSVQNDRLLLTGSAGNAGQITLIGLLIALIIIAIIVYMVRSSQTKENSH